MQNDLRANEPELQIEILGMNNFAETFGNESATDGRDIPWLQDVDADGDNRSDHWLGSWPFVYRDVVIVDANNIAVDTFNLTLHSLEEPDSYNTLRQMLIDVATEAIDAKDDLFSVVTGNSVDIDVLSNDEGLSRLEIDNVTQPQRGSVEIVNVEYAADLDSVARRVPELIISEIVPGEYIEFYNSRYYEVDLGDLPQVLVSGNKHVAISDLGQRHTIGARGYERLAWPEGMIASSSSGEFVLFRDDADGFDASWKIDDFVAWGSAIDDSKMDLAVAANKWYGPPDGTLDVGAIQRIPGTIGDEVHSYDNHRPSTPGNAINDATQTRQVLRYTPEASFVGDVQFSYVVKDDNDNMDEAMVELTINDASRPWMNASNKFDINNDGTVSPIDALLVINFLQQGHKKLLPTTVAAPFSPQPFLDCNGDGYASPIDALLVINQLIKQQQTSAASFASASEVASSTAPIADGLAAASNDLEPLLPFGRLDNGAEATASLRNLEPQEIESVFQPNAAMTSTNADSVFSEVDEWLEIA